MQPTKTLALAIAASAFLASCAGFSETAPAPGANAPGTNVTAGATTSQVIKTIASGKTPHGMDAAAGFIYNANIGENTISVIDYNTDTIVKTIAVPDGGNSGPVKAFPDGKAVVVLDTVKNRLLVIDPAQDHKIVQTVALDAAPANISFDDDDMTALVTTSGKNAYLLTFDMDRSKAPAMKTFAVGSSNAEGRSAGYSGDFGAVPSNGDNNVQLINLGTGEVKSVTDGNQPGPVAIGRDAGDHGVVAVVGNGASNTITFYQLPNGDKKTISDVGLTPTDINVDPDLHMAYLSMAGSNEVAVVDYLAETLVTKIAVGQRPVHVLEAPVLGTATGEAAASGAAATYTLAHEGMAPGLPLAHEVWIGNDKGGSVSVIDGNTNKTRATIATGIGHHKVAFWGKKAYVSNITDNTIAVIDRSLIK